MNEHTFVREADVRRIAREEIASLSGLVLRRLQEDHFTRSIERNAAEEVVDERLSQIFGEALRDFGSTSSEPGDAEA
jgi:ethanolamine utilization protein EutQ (cupin superfamily)